MAVDSRNKRAAALLLVGLGGRVYPNPDGAINNQPDRQQIAGVYQLASVSVSTYTSGQFQYLKLSSSLLCQGGGSVYGRLGFDDLLSARDITAVEDQESLTFSFPRVGADGEPRAIINQLRAGRVLTVVWEHDVIDEWRVASVTKGRGEQGVVTVECISILQDMAERADTTTGKGWVSELSAAERIFDYEIAERTASSIFSTYVIPNLPNWITLGVVEPQNIIPALTINRLTPLQVAIAVRDTLREMDVPCELRLRREGGTGYKLDLMAEIGSGQSIPVFHPHAALLSLKERTDATLQATRVLVRGATDPDNYPGVLGRSRWRGGTPSGTAIPLTDRNGGNPPVAFDGQWVGKYLLRVKTGRTFPITASNAVAGTVSCSGGIGTIAADEDFEFRLTEPLTNTRYRWNKNASITTEPVPIWVSAVDGAAVTLTLTDGFTGASTLISVDDQHVDWSAEIYTLVIGPDSSAVADTTNNWWTLTGAVTSVQVGDLVVPCINSSTVYSSNSGAWFLGRVTTIDTVNKRLTVVRFFGGGDAIVAPGTLSNSLRVYRFLRRERILDSVASTDKLTFASVSGITAAQALVFIHQADGAGEVPVYVDHPIYSQADPTGFGVKTGEITRQRVPGITQICPNSWMRTWTNSSNPPDGWVKAGAGSTTRDAVTTRFGGYSWKWSSLAATGTTFTTPAIFPNWTADHTRISCRAWVYFDVYTGNLYSSLIVFPLNADGTLDTSNALGIGNSSGVRIMPTDASQGFTKVGTGVWVELKVEGITLADGTAPYGIAARWSPVHTYVSGTGTTGYLDTVEFYGNAKCPEPSYEFGDATILLQAGNRKLDEVASPPVFYDMKARDLERSFPEEWGRMAVTMGGAIRAADPEYGTDVLVRLLKRERDLLRPMETQFLLSNRPPLLTNLVQAGITKPTTDPTVAIVAPGIGAAALTAPDIAKSSLLDFTAPATIAGGYKIYTVTTSTLTALAGSSITYVPTGATDASVTVAPALADAPPRPRRLRLWTGQPMN